MFTPPGAFSCGLKNGFSPWVKIRVAWTKTHSKKGTSEVLFTRASAPTSRHIPEVTHKARARYTATAP